jgi:hypothetical protein
MRPEPVAQQPEQRIHNPKQGPQRALASADQSHKTPAIGQKTARGPYRAILLESRARRPSVNHPSTIVRTQPAASRATILIPSPARRSASSGAGGHRAVVGRGRRRHRVARARWDSKPSTFCMASRPCVSRLARIFPANAEVLGYGCRPTIPRRLTGVHGVLGTHWAPGVSPRDPRARPRAVRDGQLAVARQGEDLVMAKLAHRRGSQRDQCGALGIECRASRR